MPLVAGRSKTFAWLGSSFVAAGLAATLVAGYEAARSAATIAELAVMLGFVQLLVWPIAIATSCLVRGLAVVWQPRRRIAALQEPDGSAPALLGWMFALAVGVALLALGTNLAIWGFSRFTAFKARSIAYLLPGIMVGIVLVIIVLVPVIAAGVTYVARRIERRLARRLGAPVLTAKRIAWALAAVLVAGLAVVWLLVLGPFLAHVDLHEVYVALMLVAALIAAHLAWLRVQETRARRAVGTAFVAIPVLAILVSFAVRVLSPALVLTVWGRGGLSADAIELVFDVYDVRDDVPASALVPTPRTGAPHRSILLVTIDTIRPDRTSTYGGPIATPALTQLAASGTMFTWAFAPANVTRRSLPSLITGLVPPRVRGRVAGWALRMDPRHVTLAERLRAGGYKTIGLFCCEGFWGPSRKLGFGRGIDDLVIDRDGQNLVDAFKARLPAMRSAPTFTWIHFIELHRWAEGNESRTRYDQLLGRVDEYVGQLVAATGTLPEERRPIIIVTGDHSEALGEHGQPYHSTDLYNSQIRIPLIIAGPGVVNTGSAEAVSLVDVAPTILDLAGFVPPSPPMMDGRSLADFLRGERASDPARGFAYAAMIVDRYVRTAARALVSEQWKIIERNDHVELYDLHDDPNERKNLAQAKPEVVREMLEKLRAREAKDRVLPF